MQMAASQHAILTPSFIFPIYSVWNDFKQKKMEFNCLFIVLYQTMSPKWIVFFFVPQSCQMLKAMTIIILPVSP